MGSRKTSARIVRFAVMFCALLAAACGSSDGPVSPSPQPSQVDQSNTPPWQGGWTVIGRTSGVVRLAQTFTPSKSTLVALDIDILTGNPGRGGDQITTRIVAGSQVVASMTRTVADGFDGALRFDLDPPVSVTPGLTLSLEVEDTGKEVFGWRYGSNAYPAGAAYFNGSPWNGGAFDFFFRTYGY